MINEQRRGRNLIKTNKQKTRLDCEASVVENPLKTCVKSILLQAIRVKERERDNPASLF